MALRFRDYALVRMRFLPYAFMRMKRFLPFFVCLSRKAGYTVSMNEQEKKLVLELLNAWEAAALRSAYEVSTNIENSRAYIKGEYEAWKKTFQLDK